MRTNGEDKSPTRGQQGRGILTSKKLVPKKKDENCCKIEKVIIFRYKKPTDGLHDICFSRNIMWKIIKSVCNSGFLHSYWFKNNDFS